MDLMVQQTPLQLVSVKNGTTGAYTNFYIVYGEVKIFWMKIAGIKTRLVSSKSHKFRV